MQPSAAHSLSSLNASDAISVCSGTLPGSSRLGCAGSSEKYALRFCSTTPVAAEVTHEPKTPYRLKISDAALPAASTAATYTVSPVRLPYDGTWSQASARCGSIRRRRLAACDFEIRRSIGTCTKRG